MLLSNYRPHGLLNIVVLITSLSLPLATASHIPFTSLLENRQTTTGIQLAAPGKFSGLGLATTCESVLYQTINCDSYVLNLGQKTYHGSLGDTALTDAVCATTCQTALATARRRISGACASTPELFPGYPVLALIDSIQTGWNETCLKDAETGGYCNDIMTSWTVTGTLEEMPIEEVCSYCLGAKLSMMQSSAYSAYNEVYAEQLAYINENCENTGNPTDQLPNPITINATTPVECAGDRTYTTQAGDTCDGVALANSVSAATFYYINPSISNCSVPLAEGKSLCLPLKCETTYTVQETDTSCIAVAVGNGVSWQKLVDWNSGLNDRCTNLISNSTASNYWGRVICVSAPGGLTEGVGSGNNTSGGGANTGGAGGSGDGYADAIVNPPSGAAVAEGTTAKCGEYVQAVEGTSCDVMLARAATPVNLFLAANPSLGTAAGECTQNLVTGLWYCLHPFRYWNTTSTAVTA